MTNDWPFDQARNVAALTTAQVMSGHVPVLVVIHYSDDHSWAFLGSDSGSTADARLVSMGQIVDMDSSLLTIAGLHPGWIAERKSVQDRWATRQDSDI